MILPRSVLRLCADWLFRDVTQPRIDQIPDSIEGSVSREGTIDVSTTPPRKSVTTVGPPAIRSRPAKGGLAPRKTVTPRKLFDAHPLAAPVSPLCDDDLKCTSPPLPTAAELHDLRDLRAFAARTDRMLQPLRETFCDECTAAPSDPPSELDFVKSLVVDWISNVMFLWSMMSAPGFKSMLACKTLNGVREHLWELLNFANYTAVTALIDKFLEFRDAHPYRNWCKVEGLADLVSKWSPPVRGASVASTVPLSAPLWTLADGDPFGSCWVDSRARNWDATRTGPSGAPAQFYPTFIYVGLSLNDVTYAAKTRSTFDVSDRGALRVGLDRCVDKLLSADPVVSVTTFDSLSPEGIISPHSVIPPPALVVTPGPSRPVSTVVSSNCSAAPCSVSYAEEGATVSPKKLRKRKRGPK